MVRRVTVYYAATVVFLLLDFALGVNIRAAFFDEFPAARLAYYAFCFACLGVVLWRPAWALVVGIAESLLSVAALTVAMMIRVLIVTDEIIEQGTGYVTGEEILNYLIVAGMAYYFYLGGIRSLKVSKVGKTGE